jgi:uncharacterized protein YeaO (DUF488 family)
MTRHRVHVRRVYNAVDPDDGTRVLVDRLWPRGLRRSAAHIDDWAKDVAPSSALRVWFHHEPARFDEFRRRYLDELATPTAQAALDRLGAIADRGPLTLLTGTRDLEHSQAVVLAELLEQVENHKEQEVTDD